MKRVKISLILNLINVAFILFAIIAMMTGFYFMGDKTALSLEGYSAFQFFTFDSNLLAGIISLIYSIYLILLLKGKIDEIPKVIHIVKYLATVAVSLTMVTVVFYLAPFASSSYFILFTNSNLFFHLISPLLAIITFIWFDKYMKMGKKVCLLSALPTVFYGIYYYIVVLTHMENGVVDVKYDWYTFAQGGVASIIISTLVMIFVTISLGWIIYLFNKMFNKRSGEENDK